MVCETPETRHAPDAGSESGGKARQGGRREERGSKANARLARTPRKEAAPCLPACPPARPPALGARGGARAESRSAAFAQAWTWCSWSRALVAPTSGWPQCCWASAACCPPASPPAKMWTSQGQPWRTWWSGKGTRRCLGRARPGNLRLRMSSLCVWCLPPPLPNGLKRLPKHERLSFLWRRLSGVQCTKRVRAFGAERLAGARRDRGSRLETSARSCPLSSPRYLSSHRPVHFAPNYSSPPSRFWLSHLSGGIQSGGPHSPPRVTLEAGESFSGTLDAPPFGSPADFPNLSSGGGGWGERKKICNKISLRNYFAASSSGMFLPLLVKPLEAVMAHQRTAEPLSSLLPSLPGFANEAAAVQS